MKRKGEQNTCRQPLRSRAFHKLTEHDVQRPDGHHVDEEPVVEVQEQGRLEHRLRKSKWLQNGRGSLHETMHGEKHVEGANRGEDRLEPW